MEGIRILNAAKNQAGSSIETFYIAHELVAQSGIYSQSLVIVALELRDVLFG